MILHDVTDISQLKLPIAILPSCHLWGSTSCPWLKQTPDPEYQVIAMRDPQMTRGSRVYSY